MNTPHLIFVRYTDIPTYLHRSEFYLSLDCDQAEEYISVPANCLWPGGAINNTEEFCQYLHTLHFWGMRHFTLEGLEFVFPTDESINDMDDELEFSARHWNTMTDVCGADSTLHAALRSAMDQNNNSNDPWDMIQPYHLILLQNDGAIARKASLVRILCRYFAREGCLDELVAMHQQYGDSIWNKWTSERAAESGNIECMQYLIDNGCACDSDAAGAAALAGHLHILQYLHNNKLGFDSNTDKWPSHVALYAVHGGHVECLAFIHENGHPWNDNACRAAGEKGDKIVLKYLLNNGCPWNKDALSWAIKHNNLDAVKVMVERGCPFPAEACATAARMGHLAVLKILHENGCPWYDDMYVLMRLATREAARYGKIDTLRYAVEHGCPLGSNILIRIFHYTVGNTDRLRCIQYLIEDQLQEMDGILFLLAFCLGYFECIRYLIDAGCPYTIMRANPDNLKIDESVDPDQFYECLKHAIERGWPLDMALLKTINDSNNEHGKFVRTVKYLQQEGLWSDVVVHDDH